MSLFLVRLGILLLLFEPLVGCASSSAKDHAYQQALHNLDTPAAACTPPIPAAVPPVEPQLVGEHPIDFYVQAALHRNPEILAAERQVAAQAEVVPQVTSLPDPVLSGNLYPSSNQTIQTAAGFVRNNLVLSQQFPWCGKLRLRGEAAELNTKIALTQLAATQLRIVEEVKLVCYDIYFNKRALKIIDESEKLLRETFIDPARAGVGKTTRLDLMRGEVELIKLRDQRISLRQRLIQAQADLSKLLSTSPDTDLTTADALVLPSVPEHLDRLYQAALISRPELQERLQSVARDDRLVALAKLNYFPDVTVGFVWYDVVADHALSRSANGENALGIAFGINLPIWQQKLRASVLEAQNRTARSARLYQSSRDETLRLIKRLTVQAHSQEQQVELFRKDLVPEAGEALRIAHEGHEKETVNPVRVVDNWLQLMTLSIQLARLEASLGQTLASLERVVGEQLTQMKDGPGSANCPPPGAGPRGQPGPNPGQDKHEMRRDEILPPPKQMDGAPPGEPE